MSSNPSYVFFRVLEGDAVGAQNVPLTPLRSLAVDRKHIPLGLPVFLPRGILSKGPLNLTKIKATAPSIL